MPMINGFTGRHRKVLIAGDDAMAALQIKAWWLSRYCIGSQVADGGRRMADNPLDKLDPLQTTVNQHFHTLAAALESVQSAFRALHSELSPYAASSTDRRRNQPHQPDRVCWPRDHLTDGQRHSLDGESVLVDGPMGTDPRHERFSWGV